MRWAYIMTDGLTDSAALVIKSSLYPLGKTNKNVRLKYTVYK